MSVPLGRGVLLLLIVVFIGSKTTSFVHAYKFKTAYFLVCAILIADPNFRLFDEIPEH